MTAIVIIEDVFACYSLLRFAERGLLQLINPFFLRALISRQSTNVERVSFSDATSEVTQGGSGEKKDDILCELEEKKHWGNSLYHSVCRHRDSIPPSSPSPTTHKHLNLVMSAPHIFNPTNHSSTATETQSSEAEDVFVPLADARSFKVATPKEPWEMLELEEDSLGKSAPSDIQIDQDEGLPKGESVSNALHRLRPDFLDNLNAFRHAMSVLPIINQALSSSLRLNAEHAKLKAQNEANRQLAVRSDSDGASIQFLQGRVVDLSTQVETLRSALKAQKHADKLNREATKGKGKTNAKSRDRKGKGKERAPASDTEANEAPAGVDPGRVAALAIALTEGAGPIEIAGQLLDEAERVGGGEWTGMGPLIGSDTESESGTAMIAVDNGIEIQYEAGPSRGSVGQRVHELEGVVDVTLARVAALEDLCKAHVQK